ncbi:MAG TPA: glycosyltransferase, partial [Bacillales bacterium]|nr:glycosyltransferase [Bacillales bacterium]
MKKVLFCATVDFHFQLFHVPYLRWFKERGWEVHVAANGQLMLPYVDHKFDLNIERSPLGKSNIAAYRELKEIIHSNDYDIIHCHTPVGGALARLAARKARLRGTKVIYTAHGFHFCKGSQVLNWILYYPIERMLARYTDCLITINQEDEEFARRHLFHAGRIEHVHGVGVDTERFKPIEEKQKDEWRKANGYEPGAFLMFYAAEFNKNKNQQLLIRSMALVQD